MAYVSQCPSLAVGGRLVKKADKVTTPVDRGKHGKHVLPELLDNRAPVIDVHWFMDNMGLNNWNERGWHGGGQIPIRNLKQRSRPSKARHWRTRQAHPSLLRVWG